jgi:hypothetical protein
MISGVQVSHAHCQDAEFPEKVLPENFCNKSSKPYPIVIKCSRPLCLPRYEWSDNRSAMIVPSSGGKCLSGHYARLYVEVVHRRD